MNYNQLTGYISVNRKILKWEWWDHIPTRNIFLICLLLASFKNVNYRGKIVKRGQFWTSLDNLSIISGFSVRNVRTALAHLIKTGELTIEPTSEGTLITVCHYDIYQDNQNENDKQNDNQATNDRQSIDNQTTNDRQSIDNQSTINRQHNNNNNNNNNDNKENKDNKENNYLIINEKKSQREVQIFTEEEIKERLQEIGIVLKEKYLTNFVNYNNQIGWKYEPETAIDLYLDVNKFAVDQKATKQFLKEREVAARERAAQNPKLQEIWSKVLDSIKEKIKADEQRIWISPIKPMKIENDSLTIAVPSKFFMEYIENNYISQISDALRAQGITNLNYQIIK